MTEQEKPAIDWKEEVSKRSEFIKSAVDLRDQINDHLIDALRYSIARELIKQRKFKCQTTWWRRLKLWITNANCRHCPLFWKVNRCGKLR